MFKIEQRMISLINKFMIPIALIIVTFTALWIRFAARKYVGNDFHFLLYDIPGNCNSVWYRMLVQWLVTRTEEIVVLLKLVSYAGDAGVVIMTCMWLGKSWLLEDKVRLFLVITALFLSPVILEYSVAGMRLDSVCMCLLLGCVLTLRKKQYLTAICPALLAAVIYPSYWLAVFIGMGVLAVMLIKQGKSAHWQLRAAIAVTLVVLIISVSMETDTGAASYFFGKIWVVNRYTGQSFSSLIYWVEEMLMLYGYPIATSLLIYSMKHRKWRIAALAVQVFMTMFVGWQQAGSMAI